MGAKAEILTIPKYAFWDTDADKLDLIGDKRNIISRIFDKGKLDDILKFIAFYGLDECIEILTGNEYLQEDAMYLAHTLLSVPLKDFKAYVLHNGISFLVALKDLPGSQRKVDIYNQRVKFLRPFLVEQGIRLASLEDIVAFKLDCICGRKEQKDYIDLAVLTDHFSFSEMMAFYQEKYPYKDKRTVLTEISKTNGIEDSDTSEMFIDMNVMKAIKKIEISLRIYTEQLIKKNFDLQSEMERRREELVQQKKTKE